MSNHIIDFTWIGSQKNFVDKPDILQLKHTVVGRYGGNSNVGQYKNEDGCLVWLNENEDWELAILLDAHNTSESAELIVEQFVKESSQIKDLLSLPTTHQTFNRLEERILNMFKSQEFLSACQNIKGETACLIVARKDKYVWWFSVGDCILFLFHPELSALGQYQVNQRQFYEWIGQVNTFEHEVPCYSSGIRELRKGINRIFLTTDGLVECPNEPFSTPKKLYDVMEDRRISDGMMTLLKTIKENNVRDSTTIISWDVNITIDVTKPSDE